MRPVPAILITLFLLTGLTRAQLVYQTSVPANNTSYTVEVAMSATSGALRMTGLELYLTPGSHVVDVEYTDQANLVNNGPWIAAGSATVFSLGMGAPTIIPINLDIIIPDQKTVVFRAFTGFADMGVDTSQTQNTVGVQGLQLSTYPTQVNSSIVGVHFCGRIHYAATVGGPRTEFPISVSPPLQGNLSRGITLDIEAFDQDIILDGFQIQANSGFNQYKLYTTKEATSYANVSFDLNSWRLVGGTPLVVLPPYTPFWVPIDFEIVIPKGTRRGFYLVDSYLGKLDTNSLASLSPPYLNSDLSVQFGELHNTPGLPFGPATGFGYLNCAIRYRVPGRASLTPGTTNSLTSSVSSSSAGRGIAFDLSATTSQQLVNIFGNVSLTGGGFLPVSTTIDLWTTLDGSSHVGQVGNAGAWKKIATVPAVVGLGLPGTFGLLGLQSLIEEGTSRGFYLTTSSTQTSFALQSGLPSPGIVATTGSLSMTTGELTSSAFAPAGSGYKVALTAVTQEVGRADRGFHETFESANVTQAPPGWLSTPSGTTQAGQAWRFDNPGGIFTSGSLLSGKTASFNSSWSGPNNPVSGSLCTPRFDASRDLDYTIQFVHRFVGGGTSQAWVEVWDGTTWNQVTTFLASTVGPPQRSSFDLTAAAGGYANAMVRFRYQGNGDNSWILDDVGLSINQKGQRPQLGLGEFDVNYAKEPLHGQPVSCGLPGPYEATASVLSPTIFHWEGEPLQPIQLFAGFPNLGNVVLSPQGQLDVGSYDPINMTFPGILLLADGTAPDIFNAAFRTSNGGELTMPVWFPPYLSGLTLHMQSVIFSSTQNIALTNMITLTVL